MKKSYKKYIVVKCSSCSIELKKRTDGLKIWNGKVYFSHSEAAEKLKLSRPGITNVISGRLIHTRGYKFQKLTEEHLIF